jgi:hypothetical protein
LLIFELFQTFLLVDSFGLVFLQPLKEVLINDDLGEFVDTRMMFSLCFFDFLLGLEFLPCLPEVMVLVQLQEPLGRVLAVLGGHLGDDFGFEGALLHFFLFSLDEVLFDLEHLAIVGAFVDNAGLIELPELVGDEIGERVDVWLEFAALHLLQLLELEHVFIVLTGLLFEFCVLFVDEEAAVDGTFIEGTVVDVGVVETHAALVSFGRRGFVCCLFS